MNGCGVGRGDMIENVPGVETKKEFFAAFVSTNRVGCGSSFTEVLEFTDENSLKMWVESNAWLTSAKSYRIVKCIPVEVKVTKTVTVELK